jgi:DnaJ family protein C protein 28
MSSPSLRQPITRSLTRRISTSSPLRNIDKRASSQLFEDAAKEEAETAEHPPKGPQVQEYRNWTGDEEIQDTVLRMLVDKYKPLRTGTIRTAEEKLSASTKPSPETRAEVLTAAYFDDSKPWNIGFRTPSHTPPIPVQAGHTLPPPRSYESLKDLENQSPEDIRLRAERKLARKLAAGPQRLGKAKESILDYKSGKDATQTDSQRMPNPVSLKGWTSLVDHRIEVFLVLFLTFQTSPLCD